MYAPPVDTSKFWKQLYQNTQNATKKADEDTLYSKDKHFLTFLGTQKRKKYSKIILLMKLHLLCVLNEILIEKYLHLTPVYIEYINRCFCQDS